MVLTLSGRFWLKACETLGAWRARHQSTAELEAHHPRALHHPPPQCKHGSILALRSLRTANLTTITDTNHDAQSGPSMGHCRLTFTFQYGWLLVVAAAWASVQVALKSSFRHISSDSDCSRPAFWFDSCYPMPGRGQVQRPFVHKETSNNPTK